MARRYWTKDEDAVLRADYTTTPTADLAERLGRKVSSVYDRAERLGLRKSWVPISTERISKGGYLERKITDDGPPHKHFRAVHLIIWESVNGPLPAGHAVTFRDGDKRNFAIDNLELVSRQELMSRNSIHRYPPELKETIRLVSKLKRTIEKKDEEQNI